jgi:hypothetical protein
MTKRRKRTPRRRVIGANWEAQQPRRGRPPADRPRKATRLYLTETQRNRWLGLGDVLAPLGADRIDVAELVVAYLEQNLHEIQTGLTGNGQTVPVGVVDLKSLYFLLDLKPPAGGTNQYNITMLTETREKLSVMTVRLQSAFRATWSQVFGLAVENMHQLLTRRRGQAMLLDQVDNLDDLKEALFQPQQLEFELR